MNKDLAATLTAIRTGDCHSWEVLVRTQTKRLYGIAWAITRDAALAEDVVQDTFLRIAEGRLPRIRRGAGEAFLDRVASRRAIDLLRRRESRRRREERHAMNREARDNEPGDPVLSSELRTELAAALAVLPGETRAALWLHYVEGHGIREVASCLGFSRSTVADHVKRGTRRLREYLRRRSLVLPAAIGWTALLESASAREVPPGLVHSLHAMAGCVVGRTAPLVMSTELGVFVMSSKKIVAATLLAFLLLLGAGVAILDPFDWRGEPARGPRGDIATRAAEDTAGKAPLSGEASAPSLASSAAESEVNPAVAVELFALGGIVYDAETRLPLEGASVEPEAERELLEALGGGTGMKVKPTSVDVLVNMLARTAGASVKAVTEANGEFELELPVGVSQYFVAAAPGYSPERHFVRQDREELNFALRPRLKVTGWILDPDDEPVPGAKIDIHGTSVGKSTTFTNNVSYEVATRSKRDGSFSIDLKMFGQPRLTVFKEGYGGTVLLGVSPGARDLVVHVPRGATVTGRVLGEHGDPATEEKVFWVTEEPGNTPWKGETLTDGDGNFEIVGLPAPATHWVHLAGLSRQQGSQLRRDFNDRQEGFVTELTVEPGDRVDGLVLELASLNAWKEAKARGEDASVSEGTLSRDLRRVRRPVLVHGNVWDPTGAPVLLANVKVEFRRSGSMHSGGAFTDRDGNFECLVGSLDPETFEVELFVYHRDWALTAMDLGERIIRPLPANASDEEADGEGERIVLGPYSAVVRYGYTVTGTVSDPRGAPLEGVQLLHHEAHGSRKIKFLGRTRADGQFRLEHLRPDASLTLTLFHPDFAPLEVARPAGFAADGQLADLGTVLLDPGGTIKGVVREADGSPLVYRYVTVDGHFFQAPARTDAAGGFVLDHVAPGTRSLRVLRGSGNLWDGGRPTEDVDPVDVESGTTRHVELRLRE